MDKDFKILERVLKFNISMPLQESEKQAIINIINAYKKEKARADKLEIDYSKMLTKLDKYEVKE